MTDGNDQPPPPLPDSSPPPLEPPPAMGPPPMPPGEADDLAGAGDAAPPMDSPQARSFLQVTEDTKTYPCESCGGQLMFNIASQKLACQHCGASFDIADAAGGVSEKDLREALAMVRSSAATQAANLIDGEKEIVCQNCGGHTTFTGSLTSQKCPYCLTPIQRDDVHDAPDRLPVDGVVPFTIDRKQADELIGKWINSRWFAPTEFKSYGKSGSFASIYGSYFTYDAETDTVYRGERGDDYTVEVGSGDNKRTETRTRWSHRQGTVHNSFDDITVMANTGFDKNRVDKLEPWPTATAKPYSDQYVAGHLCRTYDRDVEVCLDEATTVMTSEIRSSVNRDIGGDKQKIHNMDIQWRTMTYKHLLMPIWLLTVMYAGRPFQVYINGVTGEVQGSRPYSKAKIITAIAILVAVIIAIVVMVSVAKGGSS